MFLTQPHAPNSLPVSCLEQVTILSEMLLTYKTPGGIVAGADARSWLCKLALVFTQKALGFFRPGWNR